MSLIMTVPDDDDDAGAASSDDDDFVMGGTQRLAAELDDPSISGKWATSRARGTAKANAPASKAELLNARIAARAAAIDHPPAPALPIEAAADKQLDLSKPLLKAISELGFAAPTPIQAAVLPPALRGVDLCASAVTGSGKTAAFMLPVLERILHMPRRIAATRVLVLCPVRELAVQCEEMGRALARFTDVRFAIVLGGLSSKVQEAELRSRPDVVVATPGRLIDLLRNAHSLDLDDLEVLVLDEADRLLELGFQDEVEQVIRLCPRSRQTLLFSATISADVAALAKLSLDKPLQVKVDPSNRTATNLQQEFVRLRPSHEHEREAVLLSLVSRTFRTRTIVFLNQKKLAHRVKILFGLCGLQAAELHGNLTQLQRLEALDAFRDGKADFLLATDLAGRGLDIRNVQTVINYDLPTELRTYVHRVGRTARAGAAGRAVSIVAERDRPFLKQVLKHAAKQEAKTRTVPPESVAHWMERIASLEDEVSAVMEEEKTDQALRTAEMEASKASNMIVHREEILARPARTWFQSEKERQAAKESAPRTSGEVADGQASAKAGKRDKKGADANDDAKRKPPKRDKYAGMSRMKRRRLQREEMFAADAEEEGGVRLPNQKAAAKGAKGAAKRAPLGATPSQKAAGAKRALEASGGSSGGAKKRKTSSSGPAAEASSGAGVVKKPIPKKMRSHSKSKFAKPRKRK